MKIMIGGGGTGGHLVPGIAIYQEFKKRGHEMLYIMSERDKAYDVSELLQHDERFTVTLTGISRKLSLTTFRQLLSIFNVWRASYQKIKQFNPDVVVITGGYLSNIAALSALMMRKPLYILEQNSAAGITNRVWARFAKKIFTMMPQPKFIPPHKVIHTGNPLCFTSQLSKSEAKNLLDLQDNDKPVLGISGGSQGAKKINDLMLSIMPQIMDMGYQVVWSLGTKEFDRLTAENQLDSLSQYDLKAFRFINRMDAFWSASSVVVARAGAGTVSESLLFKVPTIFIPIYQSPDNHQYLNAKYLADQNCAVILEEPTLTAEQILQTIPIIQDYHNFPTKKQSPAQEIVDYISKDILE